MEDITRVTMATGDNKPPPSYISPVELEILLIADAESLHIYSKKSNIAASKAFELQNVADAVHI